MHRIEIYIYKRAQRCLCIYMNKRMQMKSKYLFISNAAIECDEFVYFKLAVGSAPGAQIFFCIFLYSHICAYIFLIILHAYGIQTEFI